MGLKVLGFGAWGCRVWGLRVLGFGAWGSRVWGLGL